MENLDKVVEDVLTEVRSMKEGIAAEKRALEAQKATFTADNPANAKTEVKTEWRDIANAIKEKRSITLNGTGVTNVVSEMVKVAASKMPLLSKVRVFNGRDASTNIPVWSPSLAVPSNFAEGETSAGVDATAVLGVTSVTPYAYISVLPVTNEALLLTGSNLESQLPSIFGEAFSKAMHAGIVTGDGNGRNMQGVFTAGVIPNSNLIDCAAVGAPKIADMVGLSLKLQDFYDDAVIVMNPAIYSALMADTTVGTDVYKQELAASKSLEGVKVILTSYAPTSFANGDIVAVGGKFSDYALAVASALSIEPMKIVGDNNTYFQAVAYFNGRVILPVNFWALVGA